MKSLTKFFSFLSGEKDEAGGPQTSQQIAFFPPIAQEPAPVLSAFDGINLKVLSQDALMDCFHSSFWGGLQDGDREKLLQETSARISAEKGLPPPYLRLRQDMAGDMMGGYAANRIELNPAFLDNPFEAMDTVFHETDHYLRDHGITESQEQTALAICEKNFGYGRCPKAGEEGFVAKEAYYGMQAEEAHANNAGFRAVTQYHEKFREEPEYLDYLKGREQFFSDMKGNYQLDPDRWKQEELAHINWARLFNGKAYDKAVDTVIAGPDSAKQEAFANAEKSAELIKDIDPTLRKDSYAAMVQRSQRDFSLLTDGNATPTGIQNGYRYNLDRMQECADRIQALDQRSGQLYSEMGQLYRANDGMPGWRYGEDPAKVSPEYANLCAEYEQVTAQRRSCVASQGMLAANNQQLADCYRNQYGQEIPDPSEQQTAPLGYSEAKGSEPSRESETEQIDTLYAAKSTENAQNAATETPPEKPEDTQKKAEDRQNDMQKPGQTQAVEPDAPSNDFSKENRSPTQLRSFEQQNGISEPVQQRTAPGQAQNGMEAVPNSYQRPQPGEDGIQDRTSSQESPAERENGISDVPQSGNAVAEKSNGIQEPPPAVTQRHANESSEGISGEDTGRANSGGEGKAKETEQGL